MSKKLVRYEIHTIKGEKQGFKVDLITGERTKVTYQYAQRRKSALKYSRNKTDVIARLKREGAGGTYKQYRLVYSGVEAEIRRNNLLDIKRHPYTITGKKRKPLTYSQIRWYAKQRTIKTRTGEATKYRFIWTYYQLKGRETDPKTGKWHYVCDDTPTFMSGSGIRNGDWYDIMVDVAKDAYENVKGDACPVKGAIEGGACVMFYDKTTGNTIGGKKFELEGGCKYRKVFGAKDIIKTKPKRKSRKKTTKRKTKKK